MLRPEADTNEEATAEQGTQDEQSPIIGAPSRLRNEDDTRPTIQEGGGVQPTAERASQPRTHPSTDQPTELQLPSVRRSKSKRRSVDCPKKTSARCGGR